MRHVGSQICQVFSHFLSVIISLLLLGDEVKGIAVAVAVRESSGQVSGRFLAIVQLQRVARDYRRTI